MHTPETFKIVLADAGILFTSEQLQVEAREDRWLVRLPGERLAWFAASEDGRLRLATERRVLRLLEARCKFAAPRILFEDSSGSFDVRSMVPGHSDPARTLAAIRDNADLAVRIGTSLGEILAEQHSQVIASDVAGWLPRRTNWPESWNWTRERLVSVVDDARLISDAETVIESYEATAVAETDRALVHGDFGLHNLAIDEKSYTVRGVFDYKEAAWADAHHDFRYLMLDADRCELLNAAISTYTKITGRTIRLGRVLLYNAACAITFLANRSGTRPEDRWCGRTLIEDLGWCGTAIRQAIDTPF